ncbi:hypothetical protein Lal_00021509 [Lupinus albus]|uniref:Putative Coiled-coil domain-containing protein n=1 Tax=Lupinus albus TaxID=3870 RepID=A0A6A5N8R4_LUPAL|nr:putative Coiled-coil domain-containing protein [Lupinus albus]KAF1881529.1 hypothetical protein Lal_00021509 [Lupinus albus]
MIQKMEAQMPETESTMADAFTNEVNKTYLHTKEMDVTTSDDESGFGVETFSKDDRQVDAGRGSFGNEENSAHIGDGKLTVLKQQEKELVDEVTVRTSELELLEQELELMTEVAEMAFNNEHSIDFYLDQLNEQIQAKRDHLLNFESEWDAVREPLEKRKRSLEESLFSNNPDALEMLQKMRELQQEEEHILSEIVKREEEHAKLATDLEKQQKVASRKSYTDRIKEITKNSRKQDADIERILKETREVQLESNSIQERLHRTYTVADEMVFREAKKDPTGKQVYRLLASIHEGFGQISDKIIATDRIRREIAEYEMKLASTKPTTSTNLDVSNLQADLDPLLGKMSTLSNK